SRPPLANHSQNREEHSGARRGLDFPGRPIIVTRGPALVAPPARERVCWPLDTLSAGTVHFRKPFSGRARDVSTTAHPGPGPPAAPAQRTALQPWEIQA